MDALTVSAVGLSGVVGVRLRRARGIELAFCAVLFLTVARALFTPDRDGAFFRVLLLGAGWAVGALSYRYHLHLERAMPYFAAAAVALSAGALIVYGLPIGWLWDRNVTADVLLLLTSWLRGPVMLLGWVAVALTGSRGAWLGLAGALLWLIARPRWYVWALLVAALAAGLVLIRPATVGVRLDIYAAAARMIAARPLFGWGIGAPVGGHFHAHNWLLDAWVNGGPLLAAGWGVFLYVIIRLIVGPPGSRARLGLLAVILHGLVDCEIWTPAIFVMALNLALLVRYRESENVNRLCADGDGAENRAPATA